MIRLASLLASLCLLVPAAAGAQSLTFDAHDVPSQRGARAIVAADFDRNGWTDLAHVNVDTGSVSVLLAHDVTGPALAATLAVGRGPFDMVTGDFNRDGIPDLAVTNADSHSISILIGRGDGRFDRSDIPAPFPASPRGIAAGDVNEDGSLDLFYTGYAGNLHMVLLGTGTGAFVAGSGVSGYGLQPQGVGAADFDHDGHLDMAVAYDSFYPLKIHYGRGDGTFAPIDVPGFSDLNAVAAGDLDGNGWPDVAAASTDRGRVAIYLGTPSGLVYRRSYAVLGDPRDVIVADVTGDGMLDVITASRSVGLVGVLPGNPAQPGAFLPRRDYAAGPGSRAVTAADLNLDARLDLATGNQYAASVSVLDNTTPTLRAAFAFTEQTRATAAVLVGTGPIESADFDHDGRIDLVARGGTSAAGFDNAVVLLAGREVVLPGPSPFATVMARDVNADGDADVLFIASDSSNLGVAGIHARIVTQLGDGGGRFSPSAETTSALWLRHCAAGRIDADAADDLLCAGHDETTGAHVVQVLPGNRDGTFRHGTRVELAGASRDLQLADVNRDGALDALVLEADVEIWLGDGRGGLRRGTSVDLAVVDDPMHLRVADVDHDSRLDLFVNGNLGQLGIARGSAAGFGPLTWASPAFSHGVSFEVADLDLTGRPDVVAGDFPGFVLWGQGDGTFEDHDAYNFAGSPFALLDVTRDGLPDIVTLRSNAVRVLVNRRTATNHPPSVIAPDRIVDYQEFHDQCIRLEAEAWDPDQHAVTFEWRDAEGRVVSSGPVLEACARQPGVYAYAVSVADGRGAVVTEDVTLTLVPATEIVLHAVTEEGTWFRGNWSAVADATAAGGYRAYDRNLRAPKVTSPAADPANAVRIEFAADPAVTYKLWVRLRADRNASANDSVWLQFSGAADVSGAPVYRIGTTSALAVNLEECVGCGLAGWGWEDDGWGAVDRSGGRLRFPDGGRQYILIQTREDGVSIDQVVLSGARYLTSRPGAAKNDTTILPRTYSPRDD